MSSGRRLLRILELMSAPAGDGSSASVCRVAAEIVETAGASVTIFDQDLPRGSLCCTDAVSALIAQLQYTLGEGPSLDAHRTGSPITEADLAAPDESRWAAFRPAALDSGARALFAFPLRIGAVRLGTLDLQRDRPGPLSDEQHADALVMADVAARAILSSQAGAPPGGLAAEIETGAELHLVVHQAAGMVSAQLDTTVTEALLRLRSHAFATATPLTDIARHVVERRLRFSEPPSRDSLDGPGCNL